MIDIKTLERAEQTEDFFDFLKKTLNLHLTKKYENTEYEIKLSPQNTAENLYEINKQVSDTFAQNSSFFIHRVEVHTNHTVFFFFSELDAFEYSVFLYNNKIMMKIKKHEKLRYDDYTVCKSSENFIYDYNAIIKILKRTDLKFIGTIQKERVKDFILDLETDIVYASAISLCTCENEKQLQYEIEYYAHYHNEVLPITEKIIINELIKGSDILISNSNFLPSNETKFEFLTKNKRTVKVKEEILSEIIALMSQF